MSVTLYKRQRQIYDFIGQYIQKNGFAPTLREIADAIGVTSLATVHEHLQALEKKGVIKGIKKGKVEGKIEGKIEGVFETAKNLKSLGVEASVIASATGLTLKEIETLGDIS